MIGRRGFMGGLAMAGGLVAFGDAPAAKESGGTACTVVQDGTSGRILTRQGPCDRRFSPCSTFKVPLALMGFAGGVLESAHAPLWDYPRGIDGLSERERKPTDPTVWLRDSIVWYSQRITRQLGAERFRGYVEAFDYGNRDLRGTPGRNDGLTQAWLMSSLMLSPDEQVRWLGRFLDRKLPVSERACALTVACMPVFPAGDGWTVRGKTGSGWVRDAAGRPDKSRQQGWFVGWAEKEGRRVIFARFEIIDRPGGLPGGPVVRESLLAALPGLLANP